MDKKLKNKIDAKVSQFLVDMPVKVNYNSLLMGKSMLKRFLYSLTPADAHHLENILDIVGEMDSDGLQDIINSAISGYTTTEQKPFVDAILNNPKFEKIINSDMLPDIIEKFQNMLEEIYSD